MGFGKRHSAFLAVVSMAVVMSLVTVPGWSQPTDEVDQAIRYLISYVSGSGLTFIRNAQEYTAVEAAEHMNRKYQHFRDDIETPDDFIELCATKSLLSGKSYLVINTHGVEMRTSDWLRTELVAYQARNQ